MHTPESLKRRIGEEIGASEWCLIDQSMIDRFAELTDDHQWIHIDRDASAQGPFGTTVAHGFLVLSMMPKLTTSVGFEIEGASMVMNYGFDKVRMINVVRAGDRIRGRCVLKDLVERNQGQWLMTMTVTTEIENQPKPAVVADWLCLQLVG